MAAKPKPEDPLNYISQDTRFGVHFDYADLCSRLRALEAAQNSSSPLQTVNILMRRAATVAKLKGGKLPGRNLRDFKQKKLQASRTVGQFTLPDRKQNRSLTPKKLMAKAKRTVGSEDVARKSSLPAVGKSTHAYSSKKEAKGFHASAYLSSTLGQIHRR